MEVPSESILATLTKYWGYSEFRNHQEDVVKQLLMGNDVLVLMATGSGKSLCYQLPAAWAYSQPQLPPGGGGVSNGSNEGWGGGRVRSAGRRLPARGGRQLHRRPEPAVHRPHGALSLLCAVSVPRARH